MMVMVLVGSRAAMPLPATSKTAFCSMSSCGVVMSRDRRALGATT